MYACLKTFSIFGLDANEVSVEVTVSPGLAKFEIIGMPDTAIRESKERIMQTIRQCGYEIPPGNLTVNLAPAEMRKKGTGLDLPIALGILEASGQIFRKDNQTVMAAGELSLSGEVRAVSGLFNGGWTAGKCGVKRFIYPQANAGALTWFRDFDKIPVEHFTQAVAAYCGDYSADTSEPSNEITENSCGDFGDVFGQDEAKRAIQLAMVGGCNLLFVGPPGCGKTMLIRRMPSLFENLSESKAIEVTRIHAAWGRSGCAIIQRPPFREVHQGITEAAFCGGGSVPTPGEMSLAHRGILFIDELPEFPRHMIQLLRTPIESGSIHVRRVGYSYTFPSRFTLAAAANPCPCGFWGDSVRACTCQASAVSRYYSRISAPVLDRIELVVYIQGIKKEHLFMSGRKTSAMMRDEMEGPRLALKKDPGLLSDERLALLPKENLEIKKVLTEAYARGFISLRRLKAALKTAQLLALFEGCRPSEKHALQAVQYCKLKWETHEERRAVPSEIF